jgi:beta-glucosidase
MLQPGQLEVFSFPLRRRDLSIWDTGAQQWRLPAGTVKVKVFVGKSV